MDTNIAPDTSWSLVPTVLYKLDIDPSGKLEAGVTSLIHNCLAYLPTVNAFVREQLHLPLSPESRWRRGGRGEGDLAACTERCDVATGYLETKGFKTKISWGGACPSQCGMWLSQYEHIAHAGLPLIVVAPREVIARKEHSWRTREGLPEQAQLLSFSGMADVIAEALRNDEPEYPLIEALLDVELVTLPRSA